jgi:hypothetical protein
MVEYIQLTLLGNNSIMSGRAQSNSAMGFLVRFERIVESLMSLISLVGFASTLLLLFIFLTTPPVTTITETSVGVQGVYQYQVKNITIQGVPFFWVFTSLVSLSAGHTYKSAKHLFLHAKGKHPPAAVADPS